MNSPAVISATPSKSMSHRLLIAAALAEGESRLFNVLESEDTLRTREILASTGVVFTSTGLGSLKVTGVGGRILGRGQACHVGESGATCRFMAAILASGQGNFCLSGTGRMHQRPFKPLGDALEKLGVRIHYRNQPGYLPLSIETNGFGCVNGMLDVSAAESSQYLSALLMAAPLGPGIYLGLSGTRVSSWPYVKMTLDAMELFGVHFQAEQLYRDLWRPVNWREMDMPTPGHLRFHVPRGKYLPRDYTAEGDWTAASYFLAAGAIGPRPVMVTGLDHNSIQGDAVILSILRRMGARVVPSSGGVVVHPGPLRGVTADLSQAPDLAPTVAALAVHAFGPTRLRHVDNLRFKESNRLAALAEELSKTGASVQLEGGEMTIHPPAFGLEDLTGVAFSTHNDHRLAMSLPLLGLPDQRGAPGFTVLLDNPGCVAKSYPGFWKAWGKVAS